MLYTPNNLLYKYIRYRFRRIKIQYNMVYDVTPEEEDEICRNLLKKRAKILIPVGIVYGLIFALTFTWLLGTSEKLNPLMQWEVRVIDYVIPFLNTAAQEDKYKSHILLNSSSNIGSILSMFAW